VLDTGSESAAIVGAKWEKERGDVTSRFIFGPAAIPANFSFKRETYSLFAEGETKLGERFSAHVGLRSDETDAFGQHATVRAGLQYRTGNSGPNLALSYGTGFKSPSFFALGNNYHMYLHPETKKFHFIPGDLVKVVVAALVARGVHAAYPGLFGRPQRRESEPAEQSGAPAV